MAGGKGFIEFDASGTGRFRFGETRGDLDGKVGLRDGKQAIDFSWEGADGSGERWGRGWAVLESNELHGTVFIHKGGETSFVAKRAKPSKRPTRK
jgi:hypothetical protein